MRRLMMSYSDCSLKWNLKIRVNNAGKELGEAFIAESHFQYN